MILPVDATRESRKLLTKETNALGLDDYAAHSVYRCWEGHSHLVFYSHGANDYNSKRWRWSCAPVSAGDYLLITTEDPAPWTVAKDCPRESNTSYPTSSLIYLFYTNYFQESLITFFTARIEVGLNKRNQNLRYGRFCSGDKRTKHTKVSGKALKWEINE